MNLNDTDWGAQVEMKKSVDATGNGAELTLALVKKSNLN